MVGAAKGERFMVTLTFKGERFMVIPPISAHHGWAKA